MGRRRGQLGYSFELVRLHRAAHPELSKQRLAIELARDLAPMSFVTAIRYITRADMLQPIDRDVARRMLAALEAVAPRKPEPVPEPQPIEPEPVAPPPARPAPAPASWFAALVQ